MRRIFFLGSYMFPRGSAGANYEQYLALSLLEAGWKVIILGSGNNREEDLQNGEYSYKGIEYYNQPWNNIVKYSLDLKFYQEMYRKYNFSRDDYFIIRDLGLIPQWWISQKLGTEHMIYVHFETLCALQYRFPFINPQFRLMQLKWHYKLRNMPKAFPISTALEEEEKPFHCKSMQLPILADPDEYGEEHKDGKPEILNFIYPGAKLNGCEDDIEMMLSAFNALDAEEKEHVRLHITGVTKSRLEQQLKDKAGIVSSLGEVLVLHDRMPYEDLVALYRSMDFLMLVRFVNQVTEANFPSKVPEVMSFGIIPVCTKVGEYTKSYLFDGKNSIVFNPFSETECINAVRRAINLSNDDYLELRTNARKTVTERFGYGNWTDRINRFILS